MEFDGPPNDPPNPEFPFMKLLKSVKPPPLPELQRSVEHVSAKELEPPFPEEDEEEKANGWQPRLIETLFPKKQIKNHQTYELIIIPLSQLYLIHCFFLYEQCCIDY